VLELQVLQDEFLLAVAEAEPIEAQALVEMLELVAVVLELHGQQLHRPE
jgi:hypothetical protein